MTSHLNSQLEVKVMRRVKAVYWLKLLAAPLLVKPALLAAFLGALWFKVSVINVIQNAASLGEPVSLYHFFSAAFRDAELAVKFLAGGLGLVALWLFLDIARNVYSLPLGRLTRISFLRPR